MFFALCMVDYSLAALGDCIIPLHSALYFNYKYRYEDVVRPRRR